MFYAYCSAQPATAYAAAPAQTAYVQPTNQTAYAATTTPRAPTYDAYQATATGQYAYAARTQVQVLSEADVHASFFNSILTYKLYHMQGLLARIIGVF